MKSAAKVGLLLIVSIVLLIGAFGVLGRSFLSKTDEYFATLSDATGITPGTRILMAGVKVGSVSKIQLDNPKLAKLTLQIDQGVAIPAGSTIVIPSSLVGLGDNPVTIVPPAVVASSLPTGSTLDGRKAGALDSFLPDGGKAGYEELTKTMAAVRKLLEDQKLKGNVETLMTTLNKTMITSQETLKQFGELAKNGNALLVKNQGTLQAMLLSAKGSITNVQSMTSSLAKFIQEGKLQKGSTQLLDQVNAIAKKADGLLASIDKTMNDPQLQGDIRSITHNFAATSESGPRLAKNAEDITANMKVITDKSKELPDKVGTLLDKAAKLEDQLSELMDKVGGVFKKGPPANPLTGMSTEMTLTRDTGAGRWRTDLNTFFPLKDGFFTLGLYDAFESNKINAQVGKNIDTRLGYRYGIYASKPGVGVDYAFTPKISFRSDVYDMNNLKFDGKLRYDFGTGLIGWLGIDRAFKDNALSIGIGIRK